MREKLCGTRSWNIWGWSGVLTFSLSRPLFAGIDSSHQNVIRNFSHTMFISRITHGKHSFYAIILNTSSSEVFRRSQTVPSRSLFWFSQSWRSHLKSPQISVCCVWGCRKHVKLQYIELVGQCSGSQRLRNDFLTVFHEKENIFPRCLRRRSFLQGPM